MARLRIVGRHPPSALVERVQSMPNVEIHADVPDVRPFLGSSGVMAVPLRIGGAGLGSRSFQALACGLPVVSSRVGAEGLILTPGCHYIQAEEDQMADAPVRPCANRTLPNVWPAESAGRAAFWRPNHLGRARP